MSLRTHCCHVAIAFALTIAITASTQGPDITEFQKFTSLPPVAQAHFGNAVAIDNDILVVGAKDDDSGAVHAGAVYLYRFVDGQWQFDLQLLPSDIEDFQMFGFSVAIDGDVIVVGSKREDEHLDKGGTIVDIGAVYVFRFNGESWLEEARLIASDFFIFDELGSAIDLEGNRILVGAHQEGTACDDDPNHNIQKNCRSGAAYVFEYDGVKWTETTKIVPPDTHVGDRFGSAVDLQGDVAVIGSWNSGNTAGPCPPNCATDGHGAAYIYRFDGTTWSLETKLVPPGGGEPFDYMGFSISLDGDRLIVGDEGDNEFEVSGGAAFVYEYHPKDPDLWVFQQKLVSSDLQFGDFLGRSVTLEGDIAVVGADFKEVGGFNGAGSAYVFTYDGKLWTEQVKLVPSDPEAFALFSFRALLNDGRLILPAIATDEGKAQNAGSAYYFAGVSDCNNNATLDLIDIIEGDSTDRNNNGIPDECEGPQCPWDLDNSGSVGASDLLALLATWGPCKGCPADFDENGAVGASDLLALLANWGPCP
ncbi:MAG: hypothetical protein V3T53_14060 [Phycisphaerales bacterium]